MSKQYWRRISSLYLYSLSAHPPIEKGTSCEVPLLTVYHYAVNLFNFSPKAQPFLTQKLGSDSLKVGAHGREELRDFVGWGGPYALDPSGPYAPVF